MLYNNKQKQATMLVKAAANHTQYMRWSLCALIGAPNQFIYYFIRGK